MVRWQPALDDYSREERSDVIPSTDKRLILVYFKRKLPQSPNTKDTVRLRHAEHPTQFKEERTIYRFETFEELWAGFRKDHPATYEKYKDSKQPHLAPRVFRENDPFQMKKAHDTGCCCIECEGMNELKRGSNGAAAKIEEVMKRLQSSVTRSANPALTSTLAKIRDIITKPSKYESIVACLHPCLPCDGKLERAKFECIKGRQCTECGFRQLWSNDVRKAVLKDNDELRSNTLLAGPEWKESKIMWRHYTQPLHLVFFLLMIVMSKSHLKPKMHAILCSR